MKFLPSSKKPFIFTMLGILFLSWLNISSSSFTPERIKERFDSVETEIYRNQRVNLPLAFKQNKELHDIAARTNNKNLHIRALYLEVSTFYNLKNIPDSLKEKTLTAMHILETRKYSESLGIVYLTMAKICLTEEIFDEAFRYSILATDVLEHTRCDYYLADAQTLAGVSLSILGEHESAVEHYQKALSFYEKSKNPYRIINLKNNLFSAQAVLSQEKSLIDSARANLSTLEELQDTAYFPWAYMTMGGIAMACHEYDSAEKYLETALWYEPYIKNKLISNVLYANLANFYIYTGQAEKALPFLKKAEENWVKENNLLHLGPLYGSYAECLAQLNRKAEAYDMLVKSLKIKNETTGKEKVSNLLRNNMNYILEGISQKMALKENETEIKKNRLLMGIAFLTAGILLSALVITLLLHKNRNIKRKKEDAQKLYVSELNLKNRELASSSLHLVAKNEILTRIQSIAETQNDPHKALEDIQRLVEHNLKADEEWKLFRIHFDKVHPLFFDKLRSHSDKLTENDLRMCAYIKIGLRIKEIASLNHISAESVKMNRYRLKKKLDLNNDDNLEDFIAKI